MSFQYIIIYDIILIFNNFALDCSIVIMLNLELDLESFHSVFISYFLCTWKSSNALEELTIIPTLLYCNSTYIYFLLHLDTGKHAPIYNA